MLKCLCTFSIYFINEIEKHKMKKNYIAPTSNIIQLEAEGKLLSASIEFGYNNEYTDREQLSNQKSEGWSSDTWTDDECE